MNKLTKADARANNEKTVKHQVFIVMAQHCFYGFKIFPSVYADFQFFYYH